MKTTHTQVRAVRAAPEATTGFTLIELLVVIVIIGILVAIVVGAVQSVVRDRKIAQAKSEVQAIATAAEEYYRIFREIPLSTNWYHTASPPDGERSDCFFAPGVWASTAPPTGGAPYSDTSRPNNYAMAREFYDRLTGSNVLNKVFLGTHRIEGVNSTNGVLRDPWGVVYDFYLDSDYSGEVHFYNYGGGVAEAGMRKDCISFVRSRGPNRQLNSNNPRSSDDVTWPPLDTIW